MSSRQETVKGWIDFFRLFSNLKFYTFPFLKKLVSRCIANKRRAQIQSPWDLKCLQWRFFFFEIPATWEVGHTQFDFPSCTNPFGRPLIQNDKSFGVQLNTKRMQTYSRKTSFICTTHFFTRNAGFLDR